MMVMQRLLIGSAASGLRRCPRRLVFSTNQSSTRFPIPITATAQYPTHAKLPAVLHIQSTTFSTNNDDTLPSSTAKSPKKKLGLIAKIRHFLRTAFGSSDRTARGIQERKDMYWVVLAVAHRKLRMENQRKLQQSSKKEDAIEQPSSLVWQEESKEQLKDLIDEAASYLDEETDINELSLPRLRNQIQSLLEPQIIQLLNVAHTVEDAMVFHHSACDEEEEDYEFSEKEEQEYKETLLREYESLRRMVDAEEEKVQELDKRRTSDPVPYYKIKKGAIETVLKYFDWWPQDAAAAPMKSINVDQRDYIDEFGFYPSMSDSEILPAMRYYHVRNLVRSSLVRRATNKTDNSNNNGNSGNNQQPHFYHSILPFKSTIPLAGRGVFIDGYAPAGTLIAFFPGKVWPKEHLQSVSLQTQTQFSENDPRDQLSMRYDDILIDSRQSPYTVVKNLWGLGHIVNHPPAPTTTAMLLQPHAAKLQSEKESSENDEDIKHHPHQGPNCGIVPINFTHQMLQGHTDKLRDYIPNEYELPPKTWANHVADKDQVIMHGMGLVALRDVKDEELFYDYRLSPDEDMKGGGNQYPSWYYVWDQEAINNRWEIYE